MISFNIKPVNRSIQKELKRKINRLNKPLGSLGKLEDIALQIGCIQNTLNPELKNPSIILFAADHGIVFDGVSSSPQDVTYQMVLNFTRIRGAGINVFTKQHGIDLKIVDSGVNYDFPEIPGLINAKIAKGTKSFLREPAMSEEECWEALRKASKVVEQTFNEGCNIIGFGEMGIGNSSSATALLAKYCNVQIPECVGRGAGLTDEGLNKKCEVLTQAIENVPTDDGPVSILRTFGGFEIAMMAGGMLKAAELGMIVLIDGFIATAALLAAHNINPDVLEYCIFSHGSGEGGHKQMLDFLKVDKPLLDFGMRLGEGTGAAIAYPVIQSAIIMLNEMTTYDDAKVCKDQIEIYGKI